LPEVVLNAVTALPPHLDHESADRKRLRLLGHKVRRRLATRKDVEQIVAGRAELWVAERFFDAVECGRLMAMIDMVARPSEAYALSYDSGVRTSYSGDVDPHDPFVRKLQRRIDSLLGLEGAIGETIQGQRYTPGQEFKAHIDWFPPNSPAWQREKVYGGQRSFTVMAYLNPVEDGGETDFPKLDIAIRPKAGALLIWNNADENGVPNPLTAHAGNPVIRGTKYVITRWYRCFPWNRGRPGVG
jgi:prolyl 4-hydroxylase